MNILTFGQQYHKPIVLALGFFDCVHVGHQKLIQSAMRMANASQAETAVFTFENNPSSFFTPSKLLYTFSERVEILEEFGVDTVLKAVFDREFMNLPAERFLAMLTDYNLKGLVCGFDYTFGAGAEGNASVLERFASERNVPFHREGEVLFDGKKAGSSLVKTYLTEGKLAEANACLNRSFSVEGIVTEGYRVGRSIGFPTANLKICEQKLYPKEGVYAGRVLWNGKLFTAIVNVGSRPTFADAEKKVEVHLLHFNGNLYGQNIRVYFDRFLRDVRSFGSAEELKQQLQKDKEAAEA